MVSRSTGRSCVQTVSVLSPLLVQCVQLLGGCVLLQQLARHLAFCGKDDAIAGEDSYCGAGERDGFQGIFDLVQASLRREDGSLEGLLVTGRST